MSAAEVYLETVARLEPEITMVDTGAALASIAISLKRIADVMERTNEYGERGAEAISGALLRGLRDR